MLKKIKCFFKKSAPLKNISSRPSWDETVALMYDKGLNYPSAVVRVMYSKDKTIRYVILKNEQGCYGYTAERIYVFDDEEWRYVAEDENALPAMWEPCSECKQNSIFDSEESALRDIQSEAMYKEYFA